MVAINKSDGPVRLIGCAPLYALQPKWTARLATQMTLYVLFMSVMMAAGAIMPWMLQRWRGWAIGDQKSLHKLFTQEEGFVYDSNNSYSFCPKNRLTHYEPLQRGYPAAPLDPRDGRLTDAWSHKPLQLTGVSWFGFNNGQGSVDGLWAGGSATATDLQAIVYQLKLLGFNTIRLPFTFDRLTDKAKDQVTQCTPGTKSVWARRATDPAVQPQPEFAAVPDPAVFLRVDYARADLCNTYLPGPGSSVLERLLWMIQFLTASGFYVVLDYHPSPDDPTPLDPHLFTSLWLMLWATISCLPNFAADIRGRLLLDLLNEPDKLGPAGIAWTRRGGTPGLEELYLSAMDSIEHVTPGDALFLLQGSAMTDKANKFGLSPGDGFVTASETIAAHGLSDPKPFFNTLLLRSYRGRVLLAPHLYAPAISGAPATAPAQLLDKLNSSWGGLTLEGYCRSSDADQLCMRFPVVAGEMGSMLDTLDEREYYRTVSLLASAASSPESAGLPANTTLPQLSGWIWWAFNANSNGTGGLVSPDWQQFLWPKLRFLVNCLGLQPWYKSPEAFIRNEAAVQADALQARGLADAAAAARTAAAAVLAEANGSQDMSDLTVVMMDGQPDSSSSSSGDSARAEGMDVPALVETTPDVRDVLAVVETLPPVVPTSSAPVARAPSAATIAAAGAEAAAVRPPPSAATQPQPDQLLAPAASASDDNDDVPAEVVELVDVPAVVDVLPAHHLQGTNSADDYAESGGGGT